MLKLASVSALAILPVLSQAAAIDVAAVVTDIGAQSVPIALIAMAVFLIFVGLKAFKWVRRALA